VIRVEIRTRFTKKEKKHCLYPLQTELEGGSRRDAEFRFPTEDRNVPSAYEVEVPWEVLVEFGLSVNDLYRLNSWLLFPINHVLPRTQLRPKPRITHLHRRRPVMILRLGLVHLHRSSRDTRALHKLNVIAFVDKLSRLARVSPLPVLFCFPYLRSSSPSPMNPQ